MGGSKRGFYTYCLCPQTYCLNALFYLYPTLSIFRSTSSHWILTFYSSLESFEQKETYCTIFAKFFVFSRFQYSSGSSVLQVLKFSRFQCSPGSSILQFLLLSRFQCSLGFSVLQVLVFFRFWCSLGFSVSRF